MLREIHKIDLISTSAKDRTVRLSLLIERGEWADPEHLWWLHEKLNGYASYALDGQMLREYPNVAGYKVLISVVPVEPPPPDVMPFLEQVDQLLKPDGIELVWRPHYRAAA